MRERERARERKHIHTFITESNGFLVYFKFQIPKIVNINNKSYISIKGLREILAGDINLKLVIANACFQFGK